MSAQPLFTPVRMGDLDLPNRRAVSPCIRGALCLCRAAESFLATLSMVP
jgi:2,4-dienoyl-CoA reductase-like NADH-dependent reductase (Old Yellow Enzyme family)